MTRKYNKPFSWKRTFLATRKKRAITLLAVLIAVALVITLVKYNARVLYENSVSAEDLLQLYSAAGFSDTRPPKLILFYNSPPHFGWIDNSLQRCYPSNCIITTDIKFLHLSSVVIFYHETLPILPVSKRRGLWIFTTSETIQRTLPFYMLPWWYGKFNWTMSYRKSSELFYGYGKLVSRIPPERDYEKIYNEKDRKVAFLVSHCNTRSRREDYVAEMKKYVDVDVIGKCGDTQICAEYVGDDNDTCHWMISRRYMFLLSFENSLCRDYVTEKFFSIYNHDMPIIPIVRGAYNVKQLIPSDAYVTTEDFASPRLLAKYLNDVIKDKYKYIDLLKKKDGYTSITSETLAQQSLCEVCAKVNADGLVSKTTYIYEWLRKDNCMALTDI